MHSGVKIVQVIEDNPAALKGHIHEYPIVQIMEPLQAYKDTDAEDTAILTSGMHLGGGSVSAQRRLR